MLNLNEIIWQIVAQIPKGKVATYGQIAKLAGYPSHARFVGSVLKKLPKDTKLPWFRVLNAQGRLSFIESSDAYIRQQTLLEKEGIRLVNGKINLALYRWNGR